MVNLLGYAGHLKDTENMIEAMLCEPHVATGTTLLGTFRIQGNMRMCFEKWIHELEPENTCYQTSMLLMLLLAAGISARMLNGRERKEVKER
jgi:hypothetical protein